MELATYIHALTGNGTSSLLVYGRCSHQLSHLAGQCAKHFIVYIRLLHLREKNNHQEYSIQCFNIWFCPYWCGSVGWVLSCKLKGHWFNSWWVHVPGLWVRSLVGGIQKAADHCFSLTSMSLSLSSSLPLSLKINKWNLKKYLILNCCPSVSGSPTLTLPRPFSCWISGVMWLCCS